MGHLSSDFTHSFCVSQLSMDSRKTLIERGKVENAVRRMRSNLAKGFSEKTT